jgi:hypothetical protein
MQLKPSAAQIVLEYDPMAQVFDVRKILYEEIFERPDSDSHAIQKTEFYPTQLKHVEVKAHAS